MPNPHYTSSEVDALIADAGPSIVSVTANGSGGSVVTISRAARTTVVLATNAHGTSSPGFQLSSGFNVGDVVEIYPRGAGANGTSLLDENGNFIGIDQFLSVGGSGPHGKRYRKVSTDASPARNWVILVSG